MRARSHYALMDASSISKCESVAAKMPAVFHRLLYGDTSNCRLINRANNEPFYCPSEDHIEHGYRRIYTWMKRENDHDQYWRLKVSAKLDEGVYLVNNYYSTFKLRYIHDNVRGSWNDLSPKYDYFRIHTKDDYILLEPTSGELARLFYCWISDKPMQFNCNGQHKRY